MKTKIPNIYIIDELIATSNLSGNETMVMVMIVVRINKNFWKPVNLPISFFLAKLSHPTFFKVRKKLIDTGWIHYKEGSKKSHEDPGTSATYFLGNQFFKTGKEILPDKNVALEEQKSSKEILSEEQIIWAKNLTRNDGLSSKEILPEGTNYLGKKSY